MAVHPEVNYVDSRLESSAPQDHATMRPLLPLRICILAVVLSAACRPPQAGPPLVSFEERVAGCYPLETGPWQHDARFASQPVPLRLPVRIQLSQIPVTRRQWIEGDFLPFFAAKSLVTPDVGAYGFGYWRRSHANSDTLRISGDARSFSIVDLRLRPEGANLGGEVRVTLGFPGDADPRIATAAVAAQRVPCPEP